MGSWSNCDFGEEPEVADLETHNEIDCLCKIYLASFWCCMGCEALAVVVVPGCSPRGHEFFLWSPCAWGDGGASSSDHETKEPGS